MNLRLALYELVERHRLGPDAAAELDRLAGFDTQPAGARAIALRGFAVAAALLVGLGLIMWIAANWDVLGRSARFALLQGLLVVSAAGAVLRPAVRAPLGLLAFLGIGGLFAYFGQTYQTGADPWQLFALWAVLALPLAVAVRSDVVWLPWTLVAMTAIPLWAQTHTGHSWRAEPGDLWIHGSAWTAALLMVAGLAGPLRRHGGAGLWSLRCGELLAITMIVLAALGSLLGSRMAPQYPLALLLLCVLLGLRGRGRQFDLFGVSAAAFGLNVLIDAGLARWLLDGHGSLDPIGILLLLGLLAAGLLAASVSSILRLARQHEGAEEAA